MINQIANDIGYEIFGNKNDNDSPPVSLVQRNMRKILDRRLDSIMTETALIEHNIESHASSFSLSANLKNQELLVDN